MAIGGTPPAGGTPPGGSTPPTFASPGLQRAALQIQAAADTEVTRLRDTAARQGAAVRQRTLESLAAIEAEGQTVLAGLRAALAARRGEIRQALTGARAAVNSGLEAAVADATAQGEQAQAEVTAEVESQRNAATEAAERQAALLETFGRENADRARRAGETTASSIDSAASSAMGGIGPVEPEVRSHVRGEVNEVADRASGDATNRAGEVADNAREAATTGARGIRDAGQELARSLGSEGSSEVVRGIQESTQATVGQLRTAAQQQLARLDALEAQAESALSQAEAQIAPAVERITAVAKSQARSVGDSLLARIDEAATGGSDALAEGAVRAIEQLRELPEPQGDGGPVAEYAAGAVTELARAGTLAGAELDEITPGLHGALGRLEAEVTSTLAQHRAAVETEVAGLATGVRAGADEAATSFAAAASTATAELAQANQQSLSDYSTGLGQQITEAEQGWIETREGVEEGIRQDVDASLQEHEALRTEMAPRLRTTAQDAAAYAQGSLVEQVISGILEGLKSFFIGLLWFALAVLVVFGLLMLGAALLGITVAAAKVLLIAIAIVGIGFMLYAFVTAMIRRSDAFWAKWGGDIPWWGQVLGFLLVFTVSVGDVFGVSGILEGLFGIDLVTWKDLDPKERAKRATEGILTLAFILLLRGVVKRLGGGRGAQPPREVPPERPPEPAPPERPPGTEPPERPPGPERPPRPPGYDPTTRTTEELRGDIDPTPRPGETPAEAAERARLAQEELVNRTVETYEALGNEPREVDVRAEEPAHGDAHTIERHGPEIPLNRADAPGGRTIEGRIYGDPPWNNAANASARWSSDAVMNRTVNDYIRGNWEAIRSDLALDGRHTASFNVGNAIGEGFFNSGAFGAGPRNAVYARTSLVRITIVLDAGPPVDFHVVTTFPNIMGGGG